MEAKKISGSIYYGLGTIYIIAAIFSGIISLLLYFTSMSEVPQNYIITPISLVAVFIGGFVSGGKGKEKGWLLGGITGLLYTLINFLFQYLGLDLLFSLEQVVFYICVIIVAMMGGILGVNITGGQKREA